MDEEKQCRICLDTTNPHDMISPCRCRGYLKYVHRACLDRWRNQNIGESFYQCNMCLFRYRFRRVWWEKIIGSKWTAVLVSLVGVGCTVWGLGWISASLANGVWYWLQYQPFCYPHRLQQLYHGLFWVGYPGMCMHMIYQDPRAINLTFSFLTNLITPDYPTEIHHHHDNVRHSTSPQSPSCSEDKSVVVQRRCYAEHETKSTGTWVCLGAGTSFTIYFTTKWFHKKALNFCNRSGRFVENTEDVEEVEHS